MCRSLRLAVPRMDRCGCHGRHKAPTRKLEAVGIGSKRLPVSDRTVDPMPIIRPTNWTMPEGGATRAHIVDFRESTSRQKVLNQPKYGWPIWKRSGYSVVISEWVCQ